MRDMEGQLAKDTRASEVFHKPHLIGESAFPGKALTPGSIPRGGEPSFTTISGPARFLVVPAARQAGGGTTTFSRSICGFTMRGWPNSRRKWIGCGGRSRPGPKPAGSRPSGVVSRCAPIRSSDISSKNGLTPFEAICNDPGVPWNGLSGWIDACRKTCGNRLDDLTGFGNLALRSGHPAKASFPPRRALVELRIRAATTLAPAAARRRAASANSGVAGAGLGVASAGCGLP
jgi:hypothetical protein